ncbi:MAG: hypothetical protein FWE85_02055, partial [Clostridiales bacterium]|nr:hypothetical protein [Clostridiales bacterium]
FLAVVMLCGLLNTLQISVSAAGTPDTAWWYAEDSDTYTISTADQLAGLAVLTNAGNRFSGKTIILSNNLDLSAYGQSYNSGKGWTPIGAQKEYFSGTFDGNGKTITGLYINTDTSYSGLFGTVYGTVKNLGVVNVNVNCGNSAGGLAGYFSIANSDSAGIENCAALNPSVTGDRYVGRVGYMAQDYEKALSGNVAFYGMVVTVFGNTKALNKGADKADGADIMSAAILADGTLGGRFTAANGWKAANGKLPGIGAPADLPAHLLNDAPPPEQPLQGSYDGSVVYNGTSFADREIKSMIEYATIGETQLAAPFTVKGLTYIPLPGALKESMTVGSVVSKLGNEKYWEAQVAYSWAGGHVNLRQYYLGGEDSMEPIIIGNGGREPNLVLGQAQYLMVGDNEALLFYTGLVTNPSIVLYWNDGDVFYELRFWGTAGLFDVETMIAIAESTYTPEAAKELTSGQQIYGP